MTPREKAARAIAVADPENEGYEVNNWPAHWLLNYFKLADAALSAALEITDEDIEAATDAFNDVLYLAARGDGMNREKAVRAALESFVARRK